MTLQRLPRRKKLLYGLLSPSRLISKDRFDAVAGLFLEDFGFVCVGKVNISRRYDRLACDVAFFILLLGGGVPQRVIDKQSRDNAQQYEPDPKPLVISQRFERAHYGA